MAAKKAEMFHVYSEGGTLCIRPYSLKARMATNKLVRNNACSLCGKRLIHPAPLRRRQNTQMCINPYVYLESVRGLLHQSNVKTRKRCHVCAECGRRFNKSWHLMKHMRTHSGEKPYVCLECGKQFKFPSILNAHKRMHKNRLPRNRQQVKDHQLPGEPYVCSQCGTGYLQLPLLLEHMRIHLSENTNARECPVCVETFPSQLMLKRHMTKHPCKLLSIVSAQKGTVKHILHVCYICKKEFKKFSCFIKHMRAHIFVESYSCSHCSGKFRLPLDLKVHLKFHTGGKDHICKYCHKGFSVTSVLVTHIQTVHRLHYVCTQCGKAFKTSSFLNAHVAIHTEEKTCVTIQSCEDGSKSPTTNAHTVDTTGEGIHVNTHNGKEDSKALTLNQNVTASTEEKTNLGPEDRTRGWHAPSLKVCPVTEAEKKPHIHNDITVSEAGSLIAHTVTNSVEEKCVDVDQSIAVSQEKPLNADTMGTNTMETLPVYNRREVSPTNLLGSHIVNQITVKKTVLCGENNAGVREGAPLMTQTVTKNTAKKTDMCIHNSMGVRPLKLLKNYPGGLVHICKYCHKGFSMTSSLVSHIKSIHARHHVCSHCCKAFKMASFLNSHMAIHTQEKSNLNAQISEDVSESPGINTQTGNTTGEGTNADAHIGGEVSTALRLNEHERIGTDGKTHIGPGDGTRHWDAPSEKVYPATTAEEKQCVYIQNGTTVSGARSLLTGMATNLVEKTSASVSKSTGVEPLKKCSMTNNVTKKTDGSVDNGTGGRQGKPVKKQPVNKIAVKKTDGCADNNMGVRKDKLLKNDSRCMDHICKYCHKGFSMTSALVSHIKTVHACHHACPHCCKAFKTSSFLKTHLAIHTGENALQNSQNSEDISNDLTLNTCTVNTIEERTDMNAHYNEESSNPITLNWHEVPNIDAKSHQGSEDAIRTWNSPSLKVYPVTKAVKKPCVSLQNIVSQAGSLTRVNKAVKKPRLYVQNDNSVSASGELMTHSVSNVVDNASMHIDNCIGIKKSKSLRKCTAMNNRVKKKVGSVDKSAEIRQTKTLGTCTVRNITAKKMRVHVKRNMGSRKSKQIKRHRIIDNTMTGTDVSYICKYCHNTFSKTSLLVTHYKSVHGHHHVCSHCGKAFKTRSFLCTHMAIHTGEKTRLIAINSKDVNKCQTISTLTVNTTKERTTVNAHISEEVGVVQTLNEPEITGTELKRNLATDDHTRDKHTLSLKDCMVTKAVKKPHDYLPNVDEVNQAGSLAMEKNIVNKPHLKNDTTASETGSLMIDMVANSAEKRHVNVENNMGVREAKLLKTDTGMNNTVEQTDVCADNGTGVRKARQSEIQIVNTIKVEKTELCGNNNTEVTQGEPLRTLSMINNMVKSKNMCVDNCMGVRKAKRLKSNPSGMDYICKYCHKGYSMPSLLVTHYKSVHAHHHVCSHCGKAFKTRYFLSAHMATHIGQKTHLNAHNSEDISKRPTTKTRMVVYTKEPTNVTAHNSKDVNATQTINDPETTSTEVNTNLVPEDQTTAGHTPSLKVRMMTKAVEKHSFCLPNVDEVNQVGALTMVNKVAKKVPLYVQNDAVVIEAESLMTDVVSNSAEKTHVHVDKSMAVRQGKPLKTHTVMNTRVKNGVKCVEKSKDTTQLKQLGTHMVKKTTTVVPHASLNNNIGNRQSKPLKWHNVMFNTVKETDVHVDNVMRVKHAKLLKNNSDGLAHVCKHCHKKFGEISLLISHRKTVHRPHHICSHCSKEFQTRSFLNTHMAIHTGGKIHLNAHNFEDANNSPTLNTQTVTTTKERTHVNAHNHEQVNTALTFNEHEKTSTNVMKHWGHEDSTSVWHTPSLKAYPVTKVVKMPRIYFRNFDEVSQTVSLTTVRKTVKKPPVNVLNGITVSKTGSLLAQKVTNLAQMTGVCVDNSMGVRDAKTLKTLQVSKKIPERTATHVHIDNRTRVMQDKPLETHTGTNKSVKKPIVTEYDSAGVWKAKPLKNQPGGIYHFCKYCHKVFNKAFLLATHIKTVHGLNDVCSQCGKAFINSSFLIAHMATHMGEKSCVNTHNSEKVSKGPWLNRHETTSAEEKTHLFLEDSIRDWQTPSLKVYTVSKAIKKTKGTTDAYTNIDREASDAVSLTSHRVSKRMNRHKLRLPGNSAYEYGNHYKQSSSQKSQMLTHASKKAHECVNCSKALNEPSDLISRIYNEIHSPVESVEESPLTFFQSHIKHDTMHEPHMHVGYGNGFSHTSHRRYCTCRSKPHLCSLCSKGFSKASHLVRHMRTHKGGTSYVCSQCGEAFSTSEALTTHGRTHTELTFSSCAMCVRGFVTLDELETHMLAHSFCEW